MKQDENNEMIDDTLEISGITNEMTFDEEALEENKIDEDSNSVFDKMIIPRQNNLDDNVITQTAAQEYDNE